MKETTRRKQFLLPQSLINQVKKAYKAKTDTEAIVLSLEQALRKKKLERLADLAGKIQLDMDLSDLRKMRGR